MPRPSSAPLLLLVLAALFASGPAAPAGDPLQIPSIWPKESRWHRELSEAAREVGKQTRGRVSVRLYERSVLAEVPEIVLYSLPLVFADDDELARVRHEMDATVIEILARRGLVALGLQHIGNAHIFSTRPRTAATGSLEDFLGARLWIPKRAGDDLFSRFGVRSPVPLAFDELRGALEKGTADTFVTTPGTALLARWHSRVTVVSRAPLMRFVAPLVVHQSEFEKLTAADRAIAQQVLGEAFAAAARTSRAKDAEAIKLLERRGTIEFVDFVDRPAWTRWARSVSDRLVADKKLPASLVQQLYAKTRS